MLVAVERQRRIQLDMHRLLLQAAKRAAHEAVVPLAAVRHQEEAPELLAEEELALLAHAGREPLRLVAGNVLVLDTPLEALGGERPGRERHATGREGDGDGERVLLVPVRVGVEQARVLRHVHGRHVRQLVTGLRVDDAERLHVLEVLVLRKLVRQLDVAQTADLGHHDDALDLLDLVVVGGRGAVEVTGDLDAQIGNGDEALENVLGHDVGDVVQVTIHGRHVHVVGPGAQVGGGDGSGAPLGLGGERLLLELRGGRDNDLLAVHVLRLGGDGCELLLLLLLLLNLRGLLSLQRGSRYLHTENDVTDFTAGQAGDVDIVLLAVVVKDEIAELRFNLDPVLVRERGPDVVILRDDRLVGTQDELRLVLVDVQSTQDEDEAGEGSVRRDALQPLVVKVEQNHLRLRGTKNHVTQLLDLHGSLEGKLQLGCADGNVGEVEQVDFQWIQQALSGDDKLLGLLFDG